MQFETARQFESARQSETHAPTSDHRSGPRRRVPRLLTGVAAVAALGMLSGGVAYAHSTGGSDDGSTKIADAVPRRAHGVRGTVAAIDGSTFVVTKLDGTGVTVTTSDTTGFSVTDPATVADAAVGSYVVVHGRTGDDGTLNAGWLAIKPAPADPAAPAGKWHWRHGVAGQVTTNDAATGILTVTTTDGVVTVATTPETKVLKKTAGTIANLAVGALVGVHGTFADDGTLAADRVKVLPVASIAPVPVQPVVQAVAQPVVPTTVAAVEPTATTSAPPSTTAAPAPSQTEVRGTVLSVEGETFALTTREGTALTVLTTAETVFGTKDCDGRDGDGASGDPAGALLAGTVATLAAVVVGVDVKVVGTLGADGALVASEVLVGAGGDGAHDGKTGSHSESNHAERDHAERDHAERGGDDSGWDGWRGDEDGHGEWSDSRRGTRGDD
jgi:hypothetical protein